MEVVNVEVLRHCWWGQMMMGKGVLGMGQGYGGRGEAGIIVKLDEDQVSGSWNSVESENCLTRQLFFPILY